MAAMNVFTVAAMVIGLFPSATAWDFIIIRNSTQKLPTLYDSIDKFNISQCFGSDNLCSNYGGQILYDKCQCICSQEKSTFGSYDGKWKCIGNAIVQQYTGCSYVLERPGIKGNHDPLFTLPVLGEHGDNNFVDKIPKNNTCTFIEANATFLECDGTWGKLTESSVTRKLAFQDQRQGLLYVGPYRSSSIADPSIDGRVIRIPIKCDGLTWDPSQCVAFKIKGQLTCTNFSGSSGNNSPTTITDKPTNTPSSPSSTTPANGTGNNNKSNGEEGTPAAAVIAGSVVGAIAFVILIVVIIVMISYWKRRKARAKKKRLRHAQENLAYEQGPDLTITLARPLSRPLPELPSQLPYEYLERGPSTIQHSNGMIPGSPGREPYIHCNGEPVYGEIDDTYSRLNHQQLKPTRSTNSTFNFAPNGPAFSFAPEAPTPAPVPVPANKSSSLKSSKASGSGICNFEEYDVVEGQIKSSLPRENTLKPGEPKSLGRDSNVTYDVPESVIRNSSAERPKSSNEDNTTVPSDTVQPTQRETPRKEVYETVWDNDDDGDDDDDLVARIDLS